MQERTRAVTPKGTRKANFHFVSIFKISHSGVNFLYSTPMRISDDKTTGGVEGTVPLKNPVPGKKSGKFFLVNRRRK